MPFDATPTEPRDAVLDELLAARERVRAGWTRGTLRGTTTRARFPLLPLPRGRGLFASAKITDTMTIEYEQVETVCAMGALSDGVRYTLLPRLVAALTVIEPPGVVRDLRRFAATSHDVVSEFAIISCWNDRVGRQQSDVVELYDVAIAMRSAEIEQP